MKVKVSIDNDGEKNVMIPSCFIKANLYQNEARTIFHFKKIDPTQAKWGNNLTLQIVSKGSSSSATTGAKTTTTTSTSTGTSAYGTGYPAGGMAVSTTETFTPTP